MILDILLTQLGEEPAYMQDLAMVMEGIEDFPEWDNAAAPSTAENIVDSRNTQVGCFVSATDLDIFDETDFTLNS